MGGYGSGRTGGRQKTDECIALDANLLQRRGWLRPGYGGPWRWRTVDGEQVGYINLVAETGRLILHYRVSQDGGDWLDVNEVVPVAWMPCRFGGSRPYFCCPGIVGGQPCRRRVGKIYAAGLYFLCRHCYNLAYASQSERRHDRLLRRASKHHAALGVKPGTSLPPKPKGMHWRTYKRHLAEIYAAESQAELAFLMSCSRWS